MKIENSNQEERAPLSQEERQSLVEVAKAKLNQLSDEELEILAGGMITDTWHSCRDGSCNGGGAAA